MILIRASILISLVLLLADQVTAKFKILPRLKPTYFDGPFIHDKQPPIEAHQGLTGVLKELEEAKRFLGSDSKVLYNNAGEVIGVEANDKPIDINQPKPSSQGNQGHSQICCRTREAFFFNTTLTDYYGNTHTIAQQPHLNTYQFIRHGLCGSKGICPGVCEQIHVTLPLIVHPTTSGQDVTFRFFKIPGYCTCRVPSSRSFLPDIFRATPQKDYFKQTKPFLHPKLHR